MVKELLERPVRTGRGGPMCPKSKPDERVEVDTEPVVPRKRHITKSGAFPRRGASVEESTSSAPPESSGSPAKRTSNDAKGMSDTVPSSAREEFVLIGVETAKATRYTFVAPRRGRKKS